VVVGFGRVAGIAVECVDPGGGLPGGRWVHVSVKVAIVINPAAGPAWRRATPAQVESWTRATIDRHSADAWVVYTKGPGHAHELARQAISDGCHVVVAWGGDGTVNEVASAILYGRAVLGIVPVGSGNGLARELGIPVNPDAALDVALGGAEREIDVGDVNGRLFFNVAGIGFDAHVAERFAASTVPVRGLIAYAATALTELVRYVGHAYTVSAEGAEIAAARALFISIANTRQWGNGARIAPHARMDDQKLDLVFVGARHPVVVAANIWRLFWGDISDMRGVGHHQIRRATIRATPPAPVHVDGEPFGRHAVIEVAVRAAALRVRVPAQLVRVPARPRAGVGTDYATALRMMTVL
jgi:YegS/Rv2252/BmrU family lipid kinase